MLKCLRQLDQFQYLPCNKQNHQSQPLNVVCPDIECECRNLLCIYCEQQQHSEHKTVPLKDYLRQMMSQTYQQIIENTQNKKIKQKNMINEQQNDQQPKQHNFKSILTYSIQADNFRIKFSQQIQKFRKQINSLLDELKTSGFLYINSLNTKIKEISHLFKHVQAIINQNRQFFNTTQEQQNLEAYRIKYQKRIKALLKYGFITEDQQIPISYQLQTLIQDSQQRFEAIRRSLNSAFKSLKDNEINKMKQTLIPIIETYTSSYKMIWSQKLKGDSMKINGNIVEKTPVNANQRFALIDKSLSPYIMKKKAISWTFRIHKLVGWIGLGICLKNKIQGSNYNFNYQSLGHGSYLVSSNGYTWSSTVKSDNSTHHSNISFTTNDYVTCQFDPVSWKLHIFITGKDTLAKKSKKCKIKSNKINKKITLDIQKPIGDQYYPCVNLCSSGDSVQIINDG